MKTKCEFPILIKSGSVTVTIYQTPSGNYSGFTLVYYQEGKRKREMFAALNAAKARADKVLEMLNTGCRDPIKLTVRQCEEYDWAVKILKPTETSLKVAVKHYAAAVEALNGAFTNFNGSVVFSSTNGIPITPAISGSFIQGAWTGTVKVAQAATNLVLRADDGLGQFGLANPVNVANLPPLSMVSAGQSLQISWPINPPGFVLETSPDLSPGSWVRVATPPLVTGDHYLQSIQTSGTNAFYRLRLAEP